MSRRPGANGASGYTNGYSSYNSPRRYEQPSENEEYDPYRVQASPRRPREPRRPGGYGGFDNSETESFEENPRVARPAGLERRQANRRSRSDERSRDSRRRSRGSPGVSAGAGGRQIEEVLDYIQKDWDFMTDEKCIPVQVALKLLDSSSLGLASRYGEFQGTHQQLQSSLKAIVNEYHQGFNSSIGTFHKIQRSLQESQQRVRTLKDSLVQAKTDLGTTKPELKGFATSSQNYDDMLQVLADIERLQLSPEKLEARISEKHFLTAVEILHEALGLIRKSEMEEIGALSDLKVYLNNQQHSLTDILMEELHSHLYLKSPYCEDRWKVYAQNQSKNTSADGSNAIDQRGRSLYAFLDKLDMSEPMVDDAARNPEADTFQYIRLIVESLYKMDCLESAVDTIAQRLPSELYKVVEKSNNEVAQRHPTTLRAYANKGRDRLDIELESDETKTSLLNDLLWTTYARFEAIAEGHRVVHDVIAGIIKREKLPEDPKLSRGFKELWQLYQNEMRSLLHDYLATDGDSGYRSRQGQNGPSDVFKRGQRDKNKRIFSLSDMDLKSSDLATEKEDLEFMLKTSVPGLISDSKTTNGINTSDSNVMHDGSATGHKLLLEPSVFNMGILLPPSLDFLNRLKEIVPPNSEIVMSTLTSFLDDFLVNVFHPQLDETLVEFCTQAFIELDAFQQDSQWAMYSQKPIFIGTTRFFNLVTAFCKMLDRLPHDQSISQLIITQMVTYYEKCLGWYKASVSRSQTKSQTKRLLKASAAFAEAGELHDLTQSIFQARNPEDKQKLIEQENIKLVASLSEDKLEEADLITERKTIISLCLLYSSMRWLAHKVNQLRYISDRAMSSSRRDGGKPKNNRWTLIASPDPIVDGKSVYLPLNHETATAFDGVISCYNELAATVLRTLHFEARARVLRSVAKSMEATYQLEQVLNEPDPDIVNLNADLVSFDEDTLTCLPSLPHTFITQGIGSLMDMLIIHLTPTVKVMNENGCGRMQLNIFVLQQNLRNIEPEASLVRAISFFDLFMAGADVTIEKAKENGGQELKELGFGYEELKVLVELYYSDAMGSQRTAVQAKRGLDDHLLQLSECMWQSGE